MISVCKIDNAFLHQFIADKVRELLDISMYCVMVVGQCELLQHISIEGTEVPTYYIKLGSFVQSLEHILFVQARFENLITFVFENPQNSNSIYLLSLEVFNPAI